MDTLKTFDYKLKPIRAQESLLDQWLGTCRFLYNLALEYKIMMYNQFRHNVSKFDLINQLPEVKKVEGYEWIKQVPALTLQSVIERLDNSFQRFFKLGSGFPKFAQKHKYKSFVLKNNSAGTEIQISGNRFKLPKIGYIKFFNSRPVDTSTLRLTLRNQSKIKTATIRKEADGWYISLTFGGSVEALPVLENNVGLDLGVKYFGVTSDGEYIDNPRHYNKYQDDLRVLQRSLDRKIKGGSNRNKARIKLAKIHQKIANTRKDFLNKVSTKLIRENQAIVVEDLRIKNLTKKSKPKLSEDGKTYLKNNRKQKSGLSKSILDCGWGMFCNMLDYKAKWFGRWFVKVPAQYTSRDCSNCSFRTDEMPLTIREWQCPKCNSFHNRDENASKNILKKWLEGQS